MPKKGIHSVGVSRQWCVQWGKVENCEGTKGSLRVEMLQQRVWLWDGEEAPGG
ncbi:MAG: hypothetical protein LAE24_04600 [Candidatus Contendobacter sp.]|nr:hypothetical protein [Candidatus Contendobacter sp.]